MNEYINGFDKAKIYKENFNLFVKSASSKYISYNNNNDTFDILLSSFLLFKSFILSLYNCFFSYISIKHKFIFRIEYILFLLVFLFSFVLTFDENSEIPTNLIISAYFPKYRLTTISYTDLKYVPEENEENDLEEISFEDLNKIIKEKMIKFKNEKNENMLECYEEIQNLNNKEYFACSNSKIKIKIKEDIINDIKIKYKSHIDNKPEICHDNSINSKKDFYNYYNKIIKYIIINILSMTFLYLYIKFTIGLKIRGSFIFNLLFILLIFNLLYVFYKKNFYLASNCFFILFIYINKNLIDSIYLKLKYKRKDFEIFSTSLISFNYRQFNLKIIILLNATIISGIFSIFLFKSFINYIIFYICLFTLIVFLSNTIEQFVPYYLKPVKNIVIFLVGIFNYFFSKVFIRYFINKGETIIKNKYSNYYNKIVTYYDEKLNNDSLYFVSDLFSFFCFDYIKGYLEFQIEISLMVDNFMDKNGEISKNKINKLALKQFWIWILILWLAMLIGIIGIFKKEYMCLIMSIYLTKTLMNYFCNIYDAKLSLFLYYLNSFLFILINLGISTSEDTYLVNLFYSFINVDKEIIAHILKIFSLLFIIYYIIVINLILCSAIIDKNKFYKEIKALKKESKDENNNNKIQKDNISNLKLFSHFGNIIIDCFVNYFIICLIIKIYLDYETYLTLRIIYCSLVIIYHTMKTNQINKIKNKIDYLFNINIWLLFSLRLIGLLNQNLSLIFFINHLNIIILLIFYFINNKKNNYFSIWIIFILFVQYYRYNSYMFIIDIILVFAFIFLINFISNLIYDDFENNDSRNEVEKNEDFESINVYNSLSLLFLLPILIFFMIQLQFQNYLNILNYVDEFIKQIIIKLFILKDEDDEKKYDFEVESIEFFIISKILNSMKLITGII